jgi:hypothetical protein
MKDPDLFDKIDEDGDWLYASADYIISEKLDSNKIKVLIQIVEASPDQAVRNLNALRSLLVQREQELDTALGTGSHDSY